MVRSSFSILFFIRESKARKSGKAPIELMITVNGERCPLSIGKQVPIDKWDKAKQQVKGKDEETQSLNNYLKAIKARLYQKGDGLYCFISDWIHSNFSKERSL
jgi:hypothetical protein